MSKLREGGVLFYERGFQTIAKSKDDHEAKDPTTNRVRPIEAVRFDQMIQYGSQISSKAFSGTTMTQFGENCKMKRLFFSVSKLRD